MPSHTTAVDGTHAVTPYVVEARDVPMANLQSSSRSLGAGGIPNDPHSHNKRSRNPFQQWITRSRKRQYSPQRLVPDTATRYPPTQVPAAVTHAADNLHAQHATLQPQHLIRRALAQTLAANLPSPLGIQMQPLDPHISITPSSAHPAAAPSPAAPAPTPSALQGSPTDHRPAYAEPHSSGTAVVEGPSQCEGSTVRKPWGGRAFQALLRTGSVAATLTGVALLVAPAAVLGTLFPAGSANTLQGSMFEAAVYCWVVLQGAGLVTHGTELLLLIIDAGLVGGLMLPVLGTVPDALIVTMSGLGVPREQAAQQVAVGIGTLAGSTVALLTLAWGGALLLGRCDLDDQGHAIDNQLTRPWDLVNTGVSVDKHVSRGAGVMMLTVLMCGTVQVPRMLGMATGPTGTGIAAGLCLAAMVAYCAYQVTVPRHRRSELVAGAASTASVSVRPSTLPSVQAGSRSSSAALSAQIPGEGGSALSRRSAGYPLGMGDHRAWWRHAPHSRAGKRMLSVVHLQPQTLQGSSAGASTFPQLQMHEPSQTHCASQQLPSSRIAQTQLPYFTLADSASTKADPLVARDSAQPLGRLHAWTAQRSASSAESALADDIISTGMRQLGLSGLCTPGDTAADSAHQHQANLSSAACAGQAGAWAEGLVKHLLTESGLSRFTAIIRSLTPSLPDAMVVRPVGAVHTPASHMSHAAGGAASPATVRNSALSALVGGMLLCAVFSDPLVDAMSAFSEASHIQPFFAAFVLVPLASTASEVVAALRFATGRRQTSISLSLSQVHGAVAMNNTLCLGLFLAVCAQQEVEWVYSSEALVICSSTLLVGSIALRQRTIRAWWAIPVLLIYPVSMGLVYCLETFWGWQ